MFFPAAFARLHTSSVAIIVVAMPLTGVSIVPAIKLSTVCCRHGIPILALIRSITVPAVNEAGEVCVCAVLTSGTASPASRKTRLELFVFSVFIQADQFSERVLILEWLSQAYDGV